MKILSTICAPHDLESFKEWLTSEGASIFRVHDVYWVNGKEKCLENHQIMFYVLDDSVATMLMLKCPPGTFTEHST